MPKKRRERAFGSDRLISRVIVSRFVGTLAVSVTISCSSPVSEPIEDEGLNMPSTIVTGIVTRSDGSPVSKTVIEGHAYTSDCSPTHGISQDSVDTDNSGGYTMKLPLGFAESACLVIRATPPATSKLVMTADSGIVVQRSQPIGVHWENVRHDFVLH